MKFVVQEHFSKHHHFDFRLEIDGVAKSWAVPKGLSEIKGEKRLAIQVADHDIDYMDFKGEIPEGMYGAGKVSIWNAGNYELIKRDEREIEIELHGEKLKGIYVIIRFQKGWLIMKK